MPTQASQRQALPRPARTGQTPPLAAGHGPAGNSRRSAANADPRGRGGLGSCFGGRARNWRMAVRQDAARRVRSGITVPFQ